MSCYEMAKSISTKKSYRIAAITTENGQELADVTIAYETFGTFRDHKTPAILLCHALTGDAHAGDDEQSPGWWGPLIGPGKTFDTDRYYIVCANVLGGCAGSTGPSSLNEKTGEYYGSSFPQITIRDMVKAQAMLSDFLGIAVWEAVIGGSMGGMQAIEWGLCYPRRVRHIAVLAASPTFSTYGIAYNAVMREAIVCDPNFHQGNYQKVSAHPDDGLRIARMLGMITYRTETLFAKRFGREQLDSHLFSPFQITSYLRYQGDKLTKRFDANSYLRLMDAMDTHDIFRLRGDAKETYQRMEAKLLFVGIENDLLFPPEQLQQATRLAIACGVDAKYEHITSEFGHDAFLLEFEQIDAIWRRFFNQKEK